MFNRRIRLQIYMPCLRLCVPKCIWYCIQYLNYRGYPNICTISWDWWHLSPSPHEDAKWGRLNQLLFLASSVLDNMSTADHICISAANIGLWNGASRHVNSNHMWKNIVTERFTASPLVWHGLTHRLDQGGRGFRKDFRIIWVGSGWYMNHERNDSEKWAHLTFKTEKVKTFKTYGRREL